MAGDIPALYSVNISVFIVSNIVFFASERKIFQLEILPICGNMGIKNILQMLHSVLYVYL